MSSRETNPNAEKLLSVKALSQTLSLSKRTIHRLNSSGKIPAPVRVGGSLRWRLEADIKPWIHMGCPDRKEFEMFAKMAQGGRK